jgi:hypothetical protein
MHISFDNTRRLALDEYYFIYKSVTFRLIQDDPAKHPDVLLTIIPQGDKAVEEHAYGQASEFLSALSWRNESEILVRHGGGYTVPENYTIHQIRRTNYDLPRLQMAGKMVLPKPSITPIPCIRTPEQRTAMTLFRDGRSTNHVYLSFLLYWQIMEVGGTKASVWVDKAHRKHSRDLHIDDYLKRLNLGGRSLGEYLDKDCRDSLAHIRRKPGKVSFSPDNAQDNKRIAISTAVVRNLSRFYIEEHLKVRELMYAIKATDQSLPEFFPESEVRMHPGIHAY